MTPTPPTVMYAVVAMYGMYGGRRYVLRRARVIHYAAHQVKFERSATMGHRGVLSAREVEQYGLRSTPEEAVAEWRKRLHVERDEHLAHAKRIDKVLAGSDPPIVTEGEE